MIYFIINNDFFSNDNPDARKFTAFSTPATSCVHEMYLQAIYICMHVCIYICRGLLPGLERATIKFSICRTVEWQSQLTVITFTRPADVKSRSGIVYRSRGADERQPTTTTAKISTHRIASHRIARYINVSSITKR